MKFAIMGILATTALLGTAFATDEALVNTLLKNGFITPGQAEAILAESNTGPARVRVEAMRDTTMSIRAKGRIHWQFGYSSLDSDYQDANTADYSTFENRRAYLGFEGEFSTPWKFDVILQIVPGNASLETSNLTYHGIENIDLGFGYMEFDAGREESTSSALIKTVERSLLAQTFDAPYAVGIWADAGFGPVTAFAAVINGEDAPDNALENDGSTKFAGNFQVFIDLGKLFEHIDGDVGFQTTQFFESDNADFDAIYSINGELVFGNFGLQADYIWGEDADGETTNGFMVMPYVEIVDNLELVFRFDRIESDKANRIGVLTRYVGQSALDDAVSEGGNASEANSGDQYTAYYLGANYYLAGNNLKLMTGVEVSELEDTIEKDATAMESTTVYGAVRARF